LLEIINDIELIQDDREINYDEFRIWEDSRGR
jgi:hypothetical protein